MNSAVLSHLSSAHRPLVVMNPQPADSGKAPPIEKYNNHVFPILVLKLGAFI